MEIDDFLEEIDNLLNDKRFTFASDTLNGIRDSVETFRTISVRQRQAITNIKASVEGRQEKKSSRRYEGWTRNE